MNEKVQVTQVGFQSLKGRMIHTSNDQFHKKEKDKEKEGRSTMSPKSSGKTLHGENLGVLHLLRP